MQTRGIEDLVRISPSIWPGKQLDLQPGDLSRFEVAGHNQHAYSTHPFLRAPVVKPTSGTIYLDTAPQRADLEALFRLLRLHSRSRSYAVFIGHAADPSNDRYLTQLRMVDKFALKTRYGALDAAGYETFPDQAMTIGELVWSFIEHEQQRWDKDKLAGVLFGDGDTAIEKLAFGFMAEPVVYGQICRVWSRAWLVTK